MDAAPDLLSEEHPANAGTSASAEAAATDAGNLPVAARPAASAIVETVNDRPSVWMSVSRSSPSEPR